MTTHTITGDCATMARRDGDYIHIPLDHPYRTAESAVVHVSDVARLIGELQAQLEAVKA